MKILRRPRCAAIIQPGEFTIDRWDGKQCSETNPSQLLKCPECGELFCMLFHWHPHMMQEGVIAQRESEHMPENREIAIPSPQNGPYDAKSSNSSRG